MLEIICIKITAFYYQVRLYIIVKYSYFKVPAFFFKDWFCFFKDFCMWCSGCCYFNGSFFCISATRTPFAVIAPIASAAASDTVIIFVFFIINSLSFLVLFKFSYILFYFSLFNCILYSVVNSDYLSDKLKKAIKKQEPMSDFPVHVIYIVSDRYIYIHILDILFRLHYSDPLMPQEVSDTLKHS